MIRDAPDPHATLSTILNEQQQAHKQVLTQIQQAQAQLQQAPQQTQLERDLKEMKQRVEAYEIEFKELKNQEVTIRQLEDKLAQAQSQVAQEKENDTRKQDWQIEQEELMNKFKEREAALQNQIQEAKKREMDVNLLYETCQNELFQLRGGFEEKQIAKQKQIDYLQEEVANQQSKIAILQAERDALTKQASINSSSSDEYV